MLDTNGRHHEPSTSGGDDVEAGWGKVADAFRANFEGDPGEIGAACSVYVDGRPVVNLWGGLADREANRPWDEDTIVQVASTTKGATAICAHLLAQRGELDLDAPVVEYWPEFGAHGKDKIPVRWLLSHQAGLPVVDGPLTFEQACAWDPVIRALEAQKPLWEPGTEHAYHAVTYGFLVGEVVRRITGRSLGAFFAEEVAGPLGLSAWIGLPEAEEKRVARFEDAAPFTLEELLAGMIATTGLDADTVTAWVRSMWSPDALQIRAGVLGGAMDPATGYFRTRAWRAAEFPAANMLADARSLARMYAATVSEVDGVRLLDPSTVETMTEVQTDKTRMHGLPPGLDIPADRSFFMSLGFWRSCAPMPMMGPGSFGHPGSGGSIGFADPDARVGFGYVTNLWNYRPDDTRAANLIKAVRSCLG
ncbi:CubicO group peptidase, beta-lactamase class C family [Streptoalloteichus tenebrarius]|uniref:CubicO group peptidase, beta-lactamase class C family n=1 Tax=Streptoalloteichus tenebrarius (strain ATCC 17920 / DSM 40477 / JCM 4838 / CBS 697.72 / NBRC 16177 / NCIMB 11028 / NRRL B-12390 / A12253. 1 / ISP 5477) TaxID=1933 RepID=A0ABT1HNR5_STRSD|nr:serine hydrolase domain-containing protein [Streptoalloteichus tenebrarius]MCP2257146.1 CubicO group peptidase, beta-lactamase class C family [Streptoalloteichus tenebrarius]